MSFFQGAIAEAGGVKALVDLIFKWSTGGDGVLVCIPTETINFTGFSVLPFLIFMNPNGFPSMVCFIHSRCHLYCFQERAAGALANLAADDKCSMEVALAGGVHALVMLARNCKFEGVQEQVM